jgi:hypothetical protein
MLLADREHTRFAITWKSRGNLDIDHLLQYRAARIGWSFSPDEDAARLFSIANLFAGRFDAAVTAATTQTCQ